MFTRIVALARNIRQSRDGAVAIFMGVVLAVLLGMTGLATEIGLVHYKRQQQQVAADAAAYGGAVALANSESATAITGEAKAIAANAGYVDGAANGVVVTVNNPPVISAAQAGNSSAVEVIIQQPQTLSIANLVTGWYGSGPINWTVKASSVATAAAGGGSCAAQLLPNQNPGVTISNGATVIRCRSQSMLKLA
jgi:Flp pilus assembly protein TadG